MSTQKLIREIERHGWQVERTRGNRLRLTHPHARHPVFASVSPSDWRAWQQSRDAPRAATGGGDEQNKRIYREGI